MKHSPLFIYYLSFRFHSISVTHFDLNPLFFDINEIEHLLLTYLYYMCKLYFGYLFIGVKLQFTTIGVKLPKYRVYPSLQMFS